jgi:hypothetical protein
MQVVKPISQPIKSLRQASSLWFGIVLEHIKHTKREKEINTNKYKDHHVSRTKVVPN